MRADNNTPKSPNSAARVTDKSVRDMPTTAKLKAGQVIVENRLQGVVFSFPAASWPDDPMHQREWVMRLTPWWDIGGIGWTPTAQRLRDACLRAINKLCLLWWCPETAHHPAAAGSGRRCQWITELKGSDDCGKRATHIRSDCDLSYCAEHARLMMPYAAFQPIAQT